MNTVAVICGTESNVVWNDLFHSVSFVKPNAMILDAQYDNKTSRKEGMLEGAEMEPWHHGHDTLWGWRSKQKRNAIAFEILMKTDPSSKKKSLTWKSNIGGRQRLHASNIRVGIWHKYIEIAYLLPQNKHKRHILLLASYTFSKLGPPIYVDKGWGETHSATPPLDTKYT